MKSWLCALLLVFLSQRTLSKFDQLLQPGLPELHVVFGNSHEVRSGDKIDPLIAFSKPSLSWNADPKSLYTAIMIDVDAPSKNDPHLSDFLHWLAVNIHGQSVSNADDLVSYRGPRPPAGKGEHRYYLLVFKQQSRISNKNVESRERFDVSAFARQNGLGEPVAASFFRIISTSVSHRQARVAALLGNDRRDIEIISLDDNSAIERMTLSSPVIVVVPLMRAVFGPFAEKGLITWFSRPIEESATMEKRYVRRLQEEACKNSRLNPGIAICIHF